MCPLPPLLTCSSLQAVVNQLWCQRGGKEGQEAPKQFWRAPPAKASTAKSLQVPSLPHLPSARCGSSCHSSLLIQKEGWSRMMSASTDAPWMDGCMRASGSACVVGAEWGGMGQRGGMPGCSMRDGGPEVQRGQVALLRVSASCSRRHLQRSTACYPPNLLPPGSTPEKPRSAAEGGPPRGA